MIVWIDAVTINETMFIVHAIDLMEKKKCNHPLGIY